MVAVPNFHGGLSGFLMAETLGPISSRRTAVVTLGREAVPRSYSRSAVRHPYESRVAWTLPTGLSAGLMVVSDSLDRNLASDK